MTVGLYIGVIAREIIEALDSDGTLRPYRQWPTFARLKELGRAIERPPRQRTPEKLWQAYKVLGRDGNSWDTTTGV